MTKEARSTKHEGCGDLLSLQASGIWAFFSHSCFVIRASPLRPTDMNAAASDSRAAHLDGACASQKTATDGDGSGDFDRSRSGRASARLPALPAVRSRYVRQYNCRLPHRSRPVPGMV